MSLVASIVPNGPVRAAAMACALSSMLGWAAPWGPSVGEVLRDEALVARLHQVHGPGQGVGPEAVDVLSLGPHGGAGLGEQRMRSGEVALGEEIGEDPDHVVAELHLVAVDTGIEGVAAPCELRGDEAALVRIDQRGVGHADLRDAGELCGPEGAHVRVVPVEAAGGGELLRVGPRRGAAETVGRHDVVVVHGVMGRYRIGCRVEGDEGGGGGGIGRDGVTGRVVDTDPAVDGDEGSAAEDDPVGELGDGDGGALVVERGHLGREEAAGVRPGRALALVDAEAVVLEQAARAVLDHERAAETGDHAVVVAQPPDGRRGPVGTGEGIGGDVERAAVGGSGARRARRCRGGIGAGRRRRGECAEPERDEHDGQGEGGGAHGRPSVGVHRGIVSRDGVRQAAAPASG